ncbi:MAG: S1C family serine protease, partial [Acidimicrobiia bacterium]|nr:S1C family serine protease [Acidimicrobiia bacterium]
IGQRDPDLIVVREQVAVQTVTTEPRVVEPAEWAAEVGEPTREAVAQLTAVDAIGQMRTGTGIVLRDDGHLVTTADLVEDAESVTIGLEGGAAVAADVVGVDPVSSLAVLHTEQPLPIALQADSAELAEGDVVAVVGSDSGDIDPRTVDRVHATVVDRQAQAHHDLAVLDGSLSDSQVGGAVVSDTGAVVGLARRVNGSAYDALVVPIEVVRSVTSQIISGDIEHAAWLGVDLKAHSEAGLAVSAVVFDGPGFDAGVRTGDVITELNGEPITSVDSVVARLDALDPNEQVTLTLQRRDQLMEPTVTLGRRPLVD